ILSTVVSQFTSSYVFNWSKYLGERPLQYPPTFDGRIVVYPSEKEVKDYFAWRQADTHINNLYNTVFWALVQQGRLTTTEAHQKLKGTVSANKNEILFTQFGINYNTVDARYRKGSVIVRSLADDTTEAPPSAQVEVEATESLYSEASVEVIGEQDVEAQRIQRRRERKEAKKAEKVAARKREWVLSVMHCDMIGEDFWQTNPQILE
ncbi:tRNA-His guanylyltransferase, partial [Tulasnella sp. 427]